MIKNSGVKPRFYPLPVLTVIPFADRRIGLYSSVFSVYTFR